MDIEVFRAWLGPSKDLSYFEECLWRLQAYIGSSLERGQLLALVTVLQNYGVLYSDGFLINDESVWDHGTGGTRRSVAMAACFSPRAEWGYDYWYHQHMMCDQNSTELREARCELVGRLLSPDVVIIRGKQKVCVAAVGPDVVWYGPWFPRIHKQLHQRTRKKKPRQPGA